VDEAQGTYHDDVLWNTILKKRQSSFLGYNFRLCLFCSYGSPEAGPDQTFFTPVRLSNQQCISLTPQSQQDSPPIGLFYDKEEFKDVVARQFQMNIKKSSFLMKVPRTTYLHSLMMKVLRTTYLHYQMAIQEQLNPY